MPMSKVNAMEQAFKNLSRLPKPYTTAELVREGERVYAASRKQEERVRNHTGGASRVNSPLRNGKLEHVSAIVNRIIYSDPVEFLGYDEFWVSLRDTRERMLVTEVYNRIREQIRRGATL
jgi:hypothetical protein